MQIPLPPSALVQITPSSSAAITKFSEHCLLEIVRALTLRKTGEELILEDSDVFPYPVAIIVFPSSILILDSTKQTAETFATADPQRNVLPYRNKEYLCKNNCTNHSTLQESQVESVLHYFALYQNWNLDEQELEMSWSFVGSLRQRWCCGRPESPR